MTREHRAPYTPCPLLILWALTSAAVLLELPDESVFSAASSSQKPVTIAFWNWWDGEREAYMKQVIASFEKEYPWIKVDSRIQSWDGFTAKIITAFAAGVARCARALKSRPVV